MDVETRKNWANWKEESLAVWKILYRKTVLAFSCMQHIRDTSCNSRPLCTFNLAFNSAEAKDKARTMAWRSGNLMACWCRIEMAVSFCCSVTFSNSWRWWSWLNVPSQYVEYSSEPGVRLSTSMAFHKHDYPAGLLSIFHAWYWFSAVFLQDMVLSQIGLMIKLASSNPQLGIFVCTHEGVLMIFRRKHGPVLIFWRMAHSVSIQVISCLVRFGGAGISCTHHISQSNIDEPYL